MCIRDSCMAAVTALSLIPATTAFAAGDIGTISFSHTYDSGGNAMRYNSSATINGYTAGGTGNYKYRMSVDGETAVSYTHLDVYKRQVDRAYCDRSGNARRGNQDNTGFSGSPCK